MNNKMEMQKEKKVLEWYLGKMYRAKLRKHQLNRRLQEINDELNSPIGGKGYSAMPRSSGGVSQGAASIVMRIAEIEDRIEDQKNTIANAMLKVMDIMDYLPINTMERYILELRYIDCLSWKRIQEEAHMTRNPCNNYRNSALHILLQNKRVKKIIKDSEYEYNDYIEKTGEKND
nr:MAG TPA: Protein of unknown function (DUF1492) [Caudoviricetes sp.]